MGAKRGKYMTYNDQKKAKNRIHAKDQYEKFYRASDWHTKAVREETYGKKIADGVNMAAKVYLEKFNHYVDPECPEAINLDRFSSYPQEKDTHVDGLVVGVYPHFLLVDCGNYKTTIPYKDLVMDKMRGGQLC